MADRRNEIEEINNSFGISHGGVVTIISEHLGRSKISARWIPRTLSAHDQLERVASSRELLEMYEADPTSFLSHLVTSDGTWIHH